MSLPVSEPSKLKFPLGAYTLRSLTCKYRTSAPNLKVCALQIFEKVSAA